jgi:hypothetical protein
MSQPNNNDPVEDPDLTLEQQDSAIVQTSNRQGLRSGPPLQASSLMSPQQVQSSNSSVSGGVPEQPLFEPENSVSGGAPTRAGRTPTGTAAVRPANRVAILEAKYENLDRKMKGMANGIELLLERSLVGNETPSDSRNSETRSAPAGALAGSAPAGSTVPLAPVERFDVSAQEIASATEAMPYTENEMEGLSVLGDRVLDENKAQFKFANKVRKRGINVMTKKRGL